MLPGFSNPGEAYPRPEGGRLSPRDILFVADVLGGGQSSFALPGENVIEHTHQGLKSPGYDRAPSRRKIET